MKKLLFLIIVITFPLHIYSQSRIASNILYGTGDINVIKSVTTSDMGIVTYGFFTGSVSRLGLSLDSYGGRDYFIAKFSQTGDLEWLRQLGSNSNDFVTGGIDALNTGYIFVTGAFRDYLKYTPDQWEHNRRIESQ